MHARRVHSTYACVRVRVHTRIPVHKTGCATCTRHMRLYLYVCTRTRMRVYSYACVSVQPLMTGIRMRPLWPVARRDWVGPHSPAAPPGGCVGRPPPPPQLFHQDSLGTPPPPNKLYVGQVGAARIAGCAAGCSVRVLRGPGCQPNEVQRDPDGAEERCAAPAGAAAGAGGRGGRERDGHGRGDGGCATPTPTPTPPPVRGLAAGRPCESPKLIGADGAEEDRGARVGGQGPDGPRETVWRCTRPRVAPQTERRWCWALCAARRTGPQAQPPPESESPPPPPRPPRSDRDPPTPPSNKRRSHKRRSTGQRRRTVPLTDPPPPILDDQPLGRVFVGPPQCAPPLSVRQGVF